MRGRRALVTGGSRGIGRAVVERLCAADAHVLAVARDPGALAAVAAATGAAVRAADVADTTAVADLCAHALALWGEVPDIVVNAAGAFALAPVVETELAVFDTILSVNLRAPFLLMQALVPAMLARGSGHVVTLGSVAGRQAFPANGAYAASKFGVRGLHAVLDAELRGTGVRATLIEPAATDTTLWDSVDREQHDGLPERAAMLDAGAVADAVVFALERPAAVAVRNILLERA